MIKESGTSLRKITKIDVVVKKIYTVYIFLLLNLEIPGLKN